MFVSEIMTTDPVTGRPDWTIRQAITELYEGDFRHLPIVDDASNELLGIISDRDLQQQMTPVMLAAEVDIEAQALLDQAQNLLDRTLGEIMAGAVVSTYPEAELDEVIELMLEHRVGALPVLDADTGDLRGIVSYVDILRAAQDVF